MIGIALLAAASIGWHPIHTSAVSLVQQPSGHTVEIIVRMFSDDLARATKHAPERPADVTDAECRTYVLAHLALRSADGSVAPITWTSRRADGPSTEIRLAATVQGGLAGAHLDSRLLTDVYADQLNLIRATYGGRTQTLLMLRSDPTKVLPT